MLLRCFLWVCVARWDWVGRGREFCSLSLSPREATQGRPELACRQQVGAAVLLAKQQVRCRPLRGFGTSTERGRCLPCKDGAPGRPTPSHCARRCHRVRPRSPLPYRSPCCWRWAAASSTSSSPGCSAESSQPHAPLDCRALAVDGRRGWSPSRAEQPGREAAAWRGALRGRTSSANQWPRDRPTSENPKILRVLIVVARPSTVFLFSARGVPPSGVPPLCDSSHPLTAFESAFSSPCVGASASDRCEPALAHIVAFLTAREEGTHTLKIKSGRAQEKGASPGVWLKEKRGPPGPTLKRGCARAQERKCCNKEQ